MHTPGAMRRDKSRLRSTALESAASQLHCHLLAFTQSTVHGWRLHHQNQHQHNAVIPQVEFSQLSAQPIRHSTITHRPRTQRQSRQPNQPPQSTAAGHFISGQSPAWIKVVITMTRAAVWSGHTCAQHKASSTRSINQHLKLSVSTALDNRQHAELAA